MQLLIPYSHGGLVNQLLEKTVAEELVYREDGVYIKTALEEADFGRFKEYLL